MPDPPRILENDGVCDWRGCLPDGREVYLENHRFLLMPYCHDGQSAHDFDADSNGVMFVGERRGLDRVPAKMRRNSTGRLVDVAFRPLRRSEHWSKSVHADLLGRQDLAEAEAYFLEMKEAYDLCMRTGPTDDPAASHYTSRGPYWAQRIEELKREEAAKAKRATAAPPAVNDTSNSGKSTLLY